MSALPSPTQVAGSHLGLYEAFYLQLDPKKTGSISAGDAAAFLKKSSLPDSVLGRIWDLGDPTGKGRLDRAGLFVTLKLIALAQNGKELTMAHITQDVPPPNMGIAPKPVQVLSSPSTPENNLGLLSSLTSAAPSPWKINPTEQSKYDKLFASLGPVNNKLPGEKVKPVMMNSKLPLEILGKVWDMSDIDKDGALDIDEFRIAIHLVYKALESHPLPDKLPAELLPAKKAAAGMVPAPPTPPQPSRPSLPGAIQVLPSAENKPPQHPPPPLQQPPPPPLIPVAPIQQPPAVQPQTAPLLQQSIPPMQQPLPPLQQTMPPLGQPIQPLSSPIPPSQTSPRPPSPQVPWVVTTEEKSKYDILFSTTDTDHDGFVSGTEIKGVFLQSGLNQHTLAHIWNLCDTKQTGKLNSEEFALAMWLINLSLKGGEPPVTLPPEMVPPSARPSRKQSNADILGSVTTEPLAINGTSYSNPELEQMSKEIEELICEKLSLESEVSYKEAEIRTRTNEVKSLQSEVDTLLATLKQLENQKGEAQKRLDDLDISKTALESSISEVKQQIDEELNVVTNLREQVHEQEESLAQQESELDGKRKELSQLEEEERTLDDQCTQAKRRVEALTTSLGETQLNITQTKTLISSLDDQKCQMSSCISSIDSAISSGNVSSVSETSLGAIILTEIDSYNRNQAESPVSSSSAFSAGEEDAFKGKSDPFARQNGLIQPSSDPFRGDDPFKGDPFALMPDISEDPFAGTDPFKDAFSTPQPPQLNAFAKSDTFGDPFAGGMSQPGGEAFGSSVAPSTNHPTETPPPTGGGPGDLFGSKPFAPPQRPASPTPALPPKKSKQPPPRPAPPRNLGGAPPPPPAPPGGKSLKPGGGAPPIPPAPSPDPFAGSPAEPFKDPFAPGEDPFASKEPSEGNNAGGGFADFANFDQLETSSSCDPWGIGSVDFLSSSDTGALRKSESPFGGDPFDPFGAPPSSDRRQRQKEEGAFSADKMGFTDSFFGIPEEDQLAWAAKDSLNMEKERQRRAKKEQDDLERALALSKSEASC